MRAARANAILGSVAREAPGRCLDAEEVQRFIPRIAPATDTLRGDTHAGTGADDEDGIPHHELAAAREENVEFLIQPMAVAERHALPWGHDIGRNLHAGEAKQVLEEKLSGNTANLLLGDRIETAPIQVLEAKAGIGRGWRYSGGSAHE